MVEDEGEIAGIEAGLGETEMPGAPPLARGGRAAVVFETLQREILTLALRPGAPLDETELAQRFGMSRSPVREALNRLAAHRLVVLLPNRSTLVAPLDLAEFPRYIEALDISQRANTRLAAKHRTEVDLAEMRRRARDFDASLARYDHLEMSGTNKAFHMAVARAGGNPYLATQYETLLDEGRRLLHMYFQHLARSRQANPLAADHHEMIEVIAAGDAEAADRAARAHTRGLHDRFVEYLRTTDMDDFEIGDAPPPAAQAGA